MATYEVTAKISAIDNLTGVLQQIAAKVASVNQQFSQTALGAGKTLGLGAFALADIAAPLAYFAATNQATLDNLARHFQVVSTGTDDQRKKMLALADTVGVKLGMPQIELLKSAAEVIQSGLADSFEDLATKGEKGVTMFERLASLAKGSNEPLNAMAVDLATIMNAFNLPKGNPEEKLSSLERIMGLLMVAPRLSPDTARTHARALAEFGAIGAQLGMQPEEASAIQNVLSLSGFPGARGGMAMKTILQRLLNPTVAAQQQMSLSGFNYGRVFGTDTSKINPDELINMLGVAGINAGVARGSIQAAVDKGYGGDLLKWKGDLADQIGTDLGLKKRDPTRKLIARALDNVVATKGGGIDMIAFLEELQKMPVAAFKDFAGLHHATKAAVMKFQESLGKYKEGLKTIRDQSSSAIDDAIKIRTARDSWGFATDQFGPALQTLRNSMWQSGFGDLAAAGLLKLNEALVKLSQIEPGTLKALTIALTAIGGTGVGLMAAGGAAWGLAAALSALRRNPLVAGAIAAGGLAAYILGKGAIDSLDSGRVNDPGGLGVHPGKATAASAGANVLKELAALLDNVGNLAGEAAVKMAKLMGMDLSDSSLARGLQKVADVLKLVNEGLAGGGPKSPWQREQGERGLRSRPDAPEGFWGRLWRNLGSMVSPQAGYNLADPPPVPLFTAPPRVPGTEFGFGPPAVPNADGSRPALFDPAQRTRPIVDRLNSPLAVFLEQIKEGQIKAQLEGAGTVDVRVSVDGPGRATGILATDDGKNIRLKTGDSMTDTNR